MKRLMKEYARMYKVSGHNSMISDELLSAIIKADRRNENRLKAVSVVVATIMLLGLIVVTVVSSINYIGR
jgi:hypothetical protein